MQVLQRHLGHRMSADTEEHSAHDTECHDDEADAKERIEPCDDLVDRQQGCQRIVNKDDSEPEEHRLPRQLGKQHRRSRHEHDTDENEEDNRKYAHDLKHDMPQILADDLRETFSILTERNHAREIVMHAACKDRTKDDPEVDAGSPERSRKRTEDRTKACDIEELDEKHLPRRQRDIVHAVFQTNRRCYLPRTPECPVDDCSIDQIADDERRERAKKCNHCLSLLPKINTRYAGVHRRPPMPALLPHNDKEAPYNQS